MLILLRFGPGFLTNARQMTEDFGKYPALALRVTVLVGQPEELIISNFCPGTCKICCCKTHYDMVASSDS